MSKITSIQWADTTVNPIMGCGGCELFPPPGEVLASIDQAVKDAGSSINSKLLYQELVNKVFLKSENAHRGHKPTVNTTNIWHLRERFAARVRRDHGKKASVAAATAIQKAITCYAATLHLNKASNILDREGLRKGEDKPRNVHPGYAPIFEMVTQFEGRSLEAAFLPDLLGLCNPETPWKERLPRMIFVSDMGDALSAQKDFKFLKEDLMPAILSEDGKRHLWLWLTKRPERMAKFADQINGFPENVCAMTTLTGPDEKSLKRLSDLKQVNASMRGLSIEPLWERIAPEKLDLSGIDWVILGGESGSGEVTRPFALEWAEEMLDHCRKSGVAFFMKQLGRNPSRNGQVFRLIDEHGGEWDEWPDETLKVREFPRAFHEYRKDEMTIVKKLRPIAADEEKAEFKRQHKIVKNGVEAFWKVGQALAVIKAKDLWRAGGHKSWDAYCGSVAGMSRGHAHRLMGAAGFLEILKTSPRGDVSPIMEAQVRPLLRLPEPEQQVTAWHTAVERAEGGQPSAPLVKEVVLEILNPEGSVAKPTSRGQQRIELVVKLKEAVTKRQSWEQVEKLLAELAELL